MANGIFERGEVYWAGDYGYIKLGVVITSNEDNNSGTHIIMSLITENGVRSGIQTEVSGRISYVMPSVIKSFRKEEMRTYVGTLAEEEMAALDERLGQLFGFDNKDQKKQFQIDELNFQVLRLKKELQYASERLENKASEVEKYKKLYEKAVDQIAEMTLAADVAKRVAELRAPVVEDEDEDDWEYAEVIEPPEVIEEPEKPSTITFPIWEPTPEKPKTEKSVKKVNVNTASTSDLMAVGFSKPAAGKINAHVKKYGPYKSVEDIKQIDEVSGKDFRKLRDYLEV